MNRHDATVPDCSVGGFLNVPGGPRTVLGFNAGWRFRQGAVDGASAGDFDDSQWPVVTLPHGLDVLPLEASGGVNYQGEAWYRKRFPVAAGHEGKRIALHFEGLMGKSRFWINGKPIGEHFGGYLPCILDVTDAVEYGVENVIAVWVDNSDDPAYPPGRPQSQLDFAYLGGIYRDVWMVTTGKVHVTDPNEVDVVAGGGVFVHYEDVSESQATVKVKAHIANAGEASHGLSIELQLQDLQGNALVTSAGTLDLGSGAAGSVAHSLVVDAPHLWHVDDPYLHDLLVEIKDSTGALIDAVRVRVGIRGIEFRGRDGFFLNGAPIDGKLIGVNRHQDYAYVGNAVPNGAHWRDAVTLREAGVRVIRCAHYPQDPAFMDACDALGMFVIITTPGWQFWNEDPVFEERVYSDIRNMVRRDRNHPSALLWEPILNETNYPDYFAQRVHEITHEEYPHSGCYTACDGGAAGQEHFDVVYGHLHSCNDVWEKTPEKERAHAIDRDAEERCVFTREWGDCPADWRAQSSPSRVPKGWGERAQLQQAEHYADPDYVFGSCYETLCAAPAQHVGGTLWHGTDHQRGYHADAFWGGILDAARQPKYSYWMFRSQLSPHTDIPRVNADPFVYIAHLMHPTSDGDVTVFSNCDEVRLISNGDVVGCLPTHPEATHMPRHPVVFKDAFRFYRHGKEGQCLEAEGLIGGEVVTRATRHTWDRRQEIVLQADLCGIPLAADGGDFVPVVARIVDKRGEVVRLTDDTIRFSVEGPAEVIGDGCCGIDPQSLTWGEAVVLVRAGVVPGTITVRAESAHPGICKPIAAELSFESVAPAREQFLDGIPESGHRTAQKAQDGLESRGRRAQGGRLTAGRDA